MDGKGALPVLGKNRESSVMDRKKINISLSESAPPQRAYL